MVARLRDGNESVGKSPLTLGYIYIYLLPVSPFTSISSPQLHISLRLALHPSRVHEITTRITYQRLNEFRQLLPSRSTDEYVTNNPQQHPQPLLSTYSFMTLMMLTTTMMIDDLMYVDRDFVGTASTKAAKGEPRGRPRTITSEARHLH